MKKDAAYYLCLQRALVEKGLTLVGKHSIAAPEDVQYHVPCTWARETTLVFHKRGLSFVVVCAHHENEGVFDQSYRSYWNLDFILEPKDYGDLLKTLPRDVVDAAWDRCDYDRTPNFRFAGYNFSPDLAGFRQGGGSRGYGQYQARYESGYEMEVSPVVAAVMTFFQAVQPNLRIAGRFKDDFPVYHLFDSDAFSDGAIHYHENHKAEDLFFERFDVAYLRRIARFRPRRK